MENQDLGDKKINNEQKVNEGFSGENIPTDYNPAKAKLQSETETDENGNLRQVERARDTENRSNATTNNPRGVSSEKDTEKTVENKDKNSDITPNRYPNSHPDNHTNRGNMELDSE